MLQTQSYLSVADNSGAKVLMVIHTFKKSTVTVGDRVIAVVKDATPNMSIKKADVVTALIIRTKKGIRRNQRWLRFDENAAVVIQSNGNPRGTRFWGVLPKEIKQLGYTKLVSLAKEVI